MGLKRNLAQRTTVFIHDSLFVDSRVMSIVILFLIQSVSIFFGVDCVWRCTRRCHGALRCFPAPRHTIFFLSLSLSFSKTFYMSIPSASRPDFGNYKVKHVILLLLFLDAGRYAVCRVIWILRFDNPVGGVLEV